ncbi:hypothetical protein ACFORH_03725 [Amycolatopsis roodepoortensis]|uniref:Na+-transporting methylmalonyl-CoA/oxaloacetate decarboxylase gamma subunit n=1 Tax=Amycolatopsis roodepoortensis TaxID=700274 RepID=A0ABR9L680_9PSEU|nr:hypothetical protein [Amycolatopsis roodepoortensis]MBE1576111.1 Na+-transporting methylmalonyl-CoA/oxaloacetate decarboxylase gamma subunit [Amycolatopsis roodepoortensis]
MSFVVPAFAVIPVTEASQFLAQQPGNGDNGGQGEDFGKSSPVGFLILILFLIAVALLVRSMTKHLKRLPESFDEPAAAPEAAEAKADAEEPVAKTEKPTAKSD